MDYPISTDPFHREMSIYSDSISELMGLVEDFREDFLGDDVRKLLKDVMRVAWDLHHSYLNLNDIHYNERHNNANPQASQSSI